MINNRENKNIDNKIVLYPSNWLYNASVIGFLKVLEEENIKNIEKIDFEDGNIKVPKEFFSSKENDPIPYAGKCLINHILKNENLDEWLKKSEKGKTNEEKHKEYVKEKFSDSPEEGYRYIRTWGKMFASNTPYQNLITIDEWKEFKIFKLIEEFSTSIKKDGLVCSFCKKRNIPIEFLHIDRSLEKKSLEKRLVNFANPHIKELGASLGEFPNSFWNNKNSVFLCPFCVYIFLHHKNAFIPTSEGEIFINAPNFKLIWDLNKFAGKILQKSNEYPIKKILGSSLLQWAIKRRTILGAWTMVNIEVIVKKGSIIDYFDLPLNITKILLDYEIANLIERIDEEKIFDLILAGKFSELEKANYHVLKTILKLKNHEEIPKNDPIKKYFKKYKDLNYLKKVSDILPELYVRISEKIKS